LISFHSELPVTGSANERVIPITMAPAAGVIGSAAKQPAQPATKETAAPAE